MDSPPRSSVNPRRPEGFRVEDAQEWVAEAEAAFEDLLVQVAAERQSMVKQANIIRLYRAGNLLSDLAIRYKVIPPKQRPAFEKAYRTFHRKRRPRNWLKWFGKHQGSIQTLRSVSKWHDKGEDPERVTEFGKFTIHNQSGADMAASLRVLEEASDQLEASGLPRGAEVLYGDVYIVGQIERRPGIVARYDPHDDAIFLLLVKRFSGKYEYGLLHELGHRYWRNVMTPAQVRAWEAHDTALRAKPAHVDVPKIGEPLEHVKGQPTVAGFRGPRILLSSGGWVGLKAYMNNLRRREMFKHFPTPYSLTNPEEHFCEAFALRALGELDEPHARAFDQVVQATPDVGRLRNQLCAQ